MEKSIVCLLRADDYEKEDVYAQLNQGLELLGGIEKFVKPEEKILVKPNLLTGAVPEKAVSTHPAVFGGILRILKEHGYEKVKYGDGPVL